MLDEDRALHSGPISPNPTPTLPVSRPRFLRHIDKEISIHFRTDKSRTESYSRKRIKHRASETVGGSVACLLKDVLFSFGRSGVQRGGMADRWLSPSIWQPIKCSLDIERRFFADIFAAHIETNLTIWRKQCVKLHTLYSSPCSCLRL